MTIRGSCHCGKTKFEVNAAPESLTACTCSYCSKTGGLWAYYPPEALTLKTPEADRALYKWNTRMIDHFFCDACGCSTYGVSPEFVDMKPHPTRKKLGVNARLFDDFDIGQVPVTVIDGKNLW